jgi:hypothetical protein
MKETTTEFPPDEPIVSAILYRGRPIICTTKRIYELVEGEVKPIPIVYEIPEEAP